MPYCNVYSFLNFEYIIRSTHILSIVSISLIKLSIHFYHILNNKVQYNHYKTDMISKQTSLYLHKKVDLVQMN